MCASVVIVPQEVIQEIVDEIKRQDAANLMPDWPARWQPKPETMQTAYPRMELSVIVSDEESQLATQMLSWGFEVTWSKQVVFNTRFDTATRPGGSLWSESLAQRRCIVPTWGFFEPHKSETFINPKSNKPNKQQYHFSSPGFPILFIAGVFQEGHFSLMTTEPNSAVAPIHHRMPVVLEPSELNTWLFGEYNLLADRSKVDLIATKV